MSVAIGLLVLPLAFAACGGGGGHSTPATPAPTGSAAEAYICPSSQSASSVFASTNTAQARVRRAFVRRSASEDTNQFIEVTYDRAVAQQSAIAIAQSEERLGGSLVASHDYPSLGVVTHIIAVPATALAQTQSALQAQAGVRSVSLTSPRYPLTISTPYYPPDPPYFNGFPAELGQPATYHVPPYDETANVPGQWDLHAIQLEDAFGYSQSGNGSGVVNANALGSSTIKIAIIDTGEDATHPELQTKIVYQKCFVTDPSGSQSTSSFATDLQGHGTNVTGIAASDINNPNFGFAGAGGNVVIYGYRVFPVPDDTCSDEDGSATPGPICDAQSSDIVSAIDDAVAQGVNVISISLGSGPPTSKSPGCTNGVDSDTAEGQAISAAEAKNIVVVAAAGNDYTDQLEAPACDSGVIAVGASALADGQPNGSGVTTGSASHPVEYVASYSNYGSPGIALNSSSAWGIVAPGGDGASSSDGDNLHWINNLWTTTPFDADFDGYCQDDYPNDANATPPVDCSQEIEGTSMATPHVAGAAALILSVNSSYQSPSKMKQLLCSTADDIGSSYEGCGRLNVYRAMAVAVGDPDPPTPAP
ncbi:MAG TPA: S8 family serine peptidase [Candidatus Acidoferrales bacterium]|nr:S8 family serine peptidase [Candidatus Acidoferrales bacterium]